MPSSSPSAGAAVLWCNLGSPAAPTAAAVRPYLAQFLGDPRVVEIPRAAWLPILHGIILRVRPAKSAAKYATVWTPQGSPLAVHTEAQSRLLGEGLAQAGHGQVQVMHAMRYGEPSVETRLQQLADAGIHRVLVLQAYPQYSGTTTASMVDAVNAWCGRARRVPELRFVADYHDDPAYIDALARSVERHWQAHGRGAMLVMSFHGIPARNIKLGDPYEQQCLRTAELLAARLGLPADAWRATFQSRFGAAEWLQPYTEPTLRELAKQGLKSVDVMCPGFPADCLETLEEIAMEAREAFLESGGEAFHYIPCLNEDADWMAALTQLAERHLQGWPTRAG